MKIKRLIACLLAAAMVLSFVVAPDTHDHDHGYVHAEVVEPAAVTEPTITVGTVVANPGDEVEIEIIVENNPGFAGLDMGIFFDGTGVTPDKGYATDSVLDTLSFTSSKAGRNPVKLIFDGAENCAESGLMAVIKATVSEDAVPGRYELRIDEENFVCTDEEFEDVIFTLVSGAVIVPCAEHTWTAGEWVTEATCTEGGERTYVCGVCTMTETRQEDALGHSFTNYVYNNDATCDTDGTETATCDRCDVTDTRTKEGSHETVDHTFGDYVYNEDATCTADGTKTRTCSVCGHQETVTAEGTKLEHSFTNYVSDGNATCDADGTKTAQCDYDCGTTDTITDEGSKEDAEHSFPAEYESDGNATCTADGTKSRVCTVCGETETVTDVGSALGHSFTNYVSNEDAKCGVDGTKTAKCDRCDETDTVTDEGSALEHSFTNYVSDGNATCAEDGTKTAQCDRCDETDTIADEGSALGHSFVTYVSNGDATCTEDGTKTAECERCDETDTVADEGSALGHKFDEETTEHLATAADCCNSATYYYTCSNPGCDEVGETTFAHGEKDMNNHIGNEVTVGAKAPTEEEEGYTGDTVCDACDTVLVKGEVIPVLDHTHILEKTEGNAANCTEAGNIEYWTCTKCGKTYADAEGIEEVEDTVIPALGHSFTNYVSNGDATCEANGTETAVCDRCDETDTREDEDSALGHNFVNYEYNNDATCEEDGTETAECERCDATDTRTAEGTALGHTAGDAVIENVVDPTCTADGSHDEVVYCTVCEKELSRNTVVDEALGHSFTEYVSDNNATCEEDGTETAKCDRCDATDTRTVEGTALGHGELVHTEGKDPACGEAGNVEHWTCSVCGKYYADEEGTTEIPAEEVEIEALEHTWGEWVVTDEPDCTTPGSQTRKCPVCEDEETEEIPALGHDWSDWYTVIEATEDNGGEEERVCSICGEKENREIPKLESPPTGDEFQFVGMTALMLASLMGMAALIVTEKKRSRV